MKKRLSLQSASHPQRRKKSEAASLRALRLAVERRSQTLQKRSILHYAAVCAACICSWRRITTTCVIVVSKKAYVPHDWRSIVLVSYSSMMLQGPRISAIGDGTRPDLLSPLLTPSGAVDNEAVRRFQTAFQSLLTNAVSTDDIGSAAESAWLSEVSTHERLPCDIQSDVLLGAPHSCRRCVLPCFVQ